MAMTMPCIDCGCLTKGSRCSGCQAKREADKWTTRRKIRSGWDWGKLREQVRARDRVCVRCGGSDRLQVHHRLAAGVSLFSLARRMGTSVEMIGRTYGHLAPDAEEYERGLLDAYDAKTEASGRRSDTEGN